MGEKRKLELWERKRLEVFQKTGSVVHRAGTSTVLASKAHWNEDTLDRALGDAVVFEERYGWYAEGVDAFYLSFDDSREDFQSALEALERELK